MKTTIKSKMSCFITAITIWMFYPACVHATGGGNAITESSIFKGIAKMISDAGVAALIIVPTVCALLIVFYSCMQGASSEPHDKEKWKKNRTSVIIVLCWVFSASALITLLASYFK